tara:strand:+ start:561 stop:812 length:252 start_codon:yes stop_codon:yes gene_type:complete
MMIRNWRDFKYEVAELFFGHEMDEAFREGQDSGAEYATRKMSFAVRNLDISDLTKTQKIGHKVSMDALMAAKREIGIRLGVKP